MTRFLAGTLALLALAVTGCNRSKVVTEIKADGAWTRTLTLTGQAGSSGGDGEGMSMQMGPKIEDTFAMPKGWQIKEEKKKTDRIMTASMMFRPGAVSKGDLTILEGAGKPALLSNEVTVKQVAPGKFEYREVLHWTGAKPAAAQLAAKDLAEIKAVLPADLATDANARGLAERVARQALPLLFGPGEPLLSIGLMHPDLAERRITQKLGGVVVQALGEQFGEKLSLAQRREIARRVITTSFNSTLQSDRVKPEPPGGPGGGADGKGKSTGLVPLMFVVKVPGKVTATNGEVDELTGEIFWGLFAEAAVLSDVVLTATSEVQR